MKKILSENEIAALYFKEHEEKTNLIWNIWSNWTLRTINEASFHFRKFKMKHFFLNQWKHFLNWCEVKFFPELAAPRFEKKPLWWIVKQEEKKEKIEYTYKQAVVVEKWFYKWLTGVVQKQCDIMWIPVDRYEVEVIFKAWTEIVEISWSDMRHAKKS